jgi:hypothetical protein
MPPALVCPSQRDVHADDSSSSAHGGAKAHEDVVVRSDSNGTILRKRRRIVVTHLSKETRDGMRKLIEIWRI